MKNNRLFKDPDAMINHTLQQRERMFLILYGLLVYQQVSRFPPAS